MKLTESYRKRLQELAGNKQVITLVPVDMDFAKKHWDEIFSDAKFGFDAAKSYVDETISKSISINDKIIGVYLLGDTQLPEILSYYDNDFKDKFSYKLEKDANIENYKDKKGIYGIFLYVLPEYRNEGYGKKLIEYSQSIGDYVWGQHDLKLNNIEHWLKKRKLIGRIYYLNKFSGYITATIQ